MPATFDEPGLRFTYPDNWQVESEERTTAARSVTVLSPGTAFWTVSRYPLESSPAELVKTVVAAIQEEYKEVEVEEVCAAYAGREMAGSDMHFHYLDLTNTTSVRWFREANALYLLVWQAEDREYESLQRVFEAMTVSLLMGLQPE